METIEAVEHYLNEAQFTALKIQWKELSDSKTVTRADIVLYNVLRGKDAKRGFVEKKRNIQGNSSWFAFKQAKLEAKVVIKKGFAERFGFETPSDILQKLE